MALELKTPAWLRLPAWLRGGAAVRHRRWSWLEPRYPGVAFDLDPRSLAMVRVGRRKKDAYVASYDVEEVPPDLVEMEFSRVRLTSPARFRAIVSRVIEKDPVRSNRASLVLPDSYARVALLPFEEMPRSRQDALDLVRWKTKKAVPFKVEEAAVDYQVLPAAGPGLTVLAVLTPRSVVEEFESAFASLGIHAGLVELSTFALINLYRPVLEKESAAGEEVLLANVCGTFFSFAIFRGGRMVFFRSKPFALMAGEDGAVGALRLLKREMQTSLVYYREKLEGKGIARAYLRVADLDPAAVSAVVAAEAGGQAGFVDPRRVVAVDGRFTGDHGERALQRIAPALGAIVGRGAP
jgi:type IV pilus assembly protein PilM